MATGGGTHARDWSWRVSIADITQNGPFSVFPGMDRHLTLIDGRGIVLRGVNGSMRLERIGGFVVFPGEEALNVEVIDGPVRVWNVMTRRGVVESATRVDQGGTVRRTGNPGQCGVALVLRGTYDMRFRADPEVILGVGDGSCWHGTVDPPILQPRSSGDIVLRTDIRCSQVMQL